jgi:hypothetical protein
VGFAPPHASASDAPTRSTAALVILPDALSVRRSLTKAPALTLASTSVPALMVRSTSLIVSCPLLVEVAAV